MDILENQLMDNRMMLARLCYNPDFVSPTPGWVGWGNRSLHLCLLTSSMCLASNLLSPVHLEMVLWMAAVLWYSLELRWGCLRPSWLQSKMSPRHSYQNKTNPSRRLCTHSLPPHTHPPTE